MTWGVLVMSVVGFLVGFRLRGGVGDGLAGFGLTVLFGFAFVWVFITLGLWPAVPGGAGSLVSRFSAEFRVERLCPCGDDAGMDAGICHLSTDDADVQHRADPHWRSGCGASSRALARLLPRAIAFVDCRDRPGFAPLAAWKLRKS